ncbi:hypothetical protein [Streptomyces sp. NPDC020681]|uniref:hypothetical protein n=1 Tax=Streptomyces sp. NPDC020681 TaxID=3365083 RepID=UPI0037ACAB05
MNTAHMVRAGIVMLALLIAPSVATATAHAQTADQAIVAAPSTATGGDEDTPWGP